MSFSNSKPSFGLEVCTDRFLKKKWQESAKIEKDLGIKENFYKTKHFFTDVEGVSQNL